MLASISHSHKNFFRTDILKTKAGRESFSGHITAIKMADSENRWASISSINVSLLPSKMSYLTINLTLVLLLTEIIATDSTESQAKAGTVV